MIVREDEQGMLLIRQTDHARLSGTIACAWGVLYARAASLLVAAVRHDDGWAQWELSPRLDEDGRPVDFTSISMEEWTTLYRSGIDMVEVEDPYAGLIVSMHGERLLTRPFVEGTAPRIDQLEGRDHELASAYVAFERQRQVVLAETAIEEEGGPLVTGDLPADAEEGWRLLQVWDRLSLFWCMGQFSPGTSITMPPYQGPAEADVEMTATGMDDGSLALDPYPFGSAKRRFRMIATRMDDDRWTDLKAFREAYRTGTPEVLTLEVGPA